MTTKQKPSDMSYGLILSEYATREFHERRFDSLNVKNVWEIKLLKLIENWA